MSQSCSQSCSPSAAIAALACVLCAGCGGSGGGAGAAPAAFADPGAAPSAGSSSGGASGAAPAGGASSGSSAPVSAPDRGASSGSRPAGEAPSRDGSADARRVRTALERAGAHALVGLARKLETGTPLTGPETDCVGDHDRALGEPLAALDCAAPLPVRATAVAVRSVSLLPDDACLAVLGDSSRGAADIVAGCGWRTASLELATEWIVPSDDGAGRAGRPWPLAGATFDYVAPATLVATNLPARLTGAFACTASLDAGSVEPMSGDDGSDCAAGMAAFADRLEAVADALDAAAAGG